MTTRGKLSPALAGLALVALAGCSDTTDDAPAPAPAPASASASASASNMADAALAEAAALEKQVRDFASTGGTTVENPNDLESAELLPPDEYEVRQFFWDPSSHRICVVHKETGAWGLVAAEGGDTFENSGPSGAACEVG